MAQVLRNLLSNAIKFTPIEGEVEVTIDSKNEQLEISVRDSGVGISPENQGRLFGEVIQFHAKAHQGGGGSGLGLWISKKIMDMHGGSISVHSEGEGKGSVFSISLPMRQNETAATYEPNVRPVEVASPLQRQLSAFRKTKDGFVKNCSNKKVVGQISLLPPLRILVVDDSALNRKMLTRGFSKEGYSVVEADDGDTAIEVVSKELRQGRPFDLITMDNVLRLDIRYMSLISY